MDFSDGQCRVPSLHGCLTVSSQDGQKHDVPLFKDDPLIFKLQKNWVGEGHRIPKITKGHFIIIAPVTWERTGDEPVAPDGCTDPDFRAHYFHRDATTSDEIVGGFQEWKGSFAAIGIELTGQHIHDDSDHGVLFGGSDPPWIKSPQEIARARVGEEKKHGWEGQNFEPNKQRLSEILNGREGRFFLRIYNSNAKLLDSVAFRYLRDLTQIEVDGTEYDESMALAPTETGYPPRTEIRFIGANGSSLTPALPSGAHQKVAPSGAIVVPPHPDADRVTCCLGSGAGTVNIVLDLPRIWWRLEDGRAEPGEWRDTPLAMTREDFRHHAHAGATLLLLSRRHASVQVGFDDEPKLPYRRKAKEDRIRIPLDHFADHTQIRRRLNADANFNVVWAGKTVPLIMISADPMPEIVSFTAEPARIVADEETALEWATRNADNASLFIEPNIGEVGPNGTCTLPPARTTRYTLTLAVDGVDDIIESITVVVDPPTKLDELSGPRVLSPAGRWRTGKGFSSGELEAAGLTLAAATERSIHIDRRRRTSHPANIEMIWRMLNG